MFIIFSVCTTAEFLHRKIIEQERVQQGLIINTQLCKYNHIRLPSIEEHGEFNKSVKAKIEEMKTQAIQKKNCKKEKEGKVCFPIHGLCKANCKEY